MSLPAVPCPYCGARRVDRCVTKDGTPTAPHRNRIALAAAPAPRQYVWKGVAYRIYCDICKVPVAVDKAGVILAHPSRRGTEWCLMSYKPDVEGKRVEPPASSS